MKEKNRQSCLQDEETFETKDFQRSDNKMITALIEAKADVQAFKKLINNNNTKIYNENTDYIHNTAAVSSTARTESKTNNIHALPEEVIRQIASNLSRHDTARLSASCKLFHKPLKEDLEQLALKKLLQHVAYGEQKEAENMAENNPSLLLKKGEVVDYSGRIIEGTALQIALGAKDVGIQKNEECMVEMIQKHLRKLKNGDDTIAEQTHEQFPSGWEDEEKKKDEMDQDALKTIVKVITESKQDDDCAAALNEFRGYLTNRFTKNVVKTGFHFNDHFLLEAFNLYEQKYDRLGGWDSRQNNLFWRNIIGSIQRFLPTCDAQAFCQGTYYIVENHEKLNRSLKFRYGSNIPFFPLDSDPHFRLGFDFAMRGRGCGERGVAAGLGDAFRCLARLVFRTYVEQKRLRCRLMQLLACQTSKDRCIIL